MARWEWVRWIGATKSPATRAKRVDVTISKMRSGKRRPCCFDLASCTDPELMKNGELIAPEDAPLRPAVPLEHAMQRLAQRGAQRHLQPRRHGGPHGR